MTHEETRGGMKAEVARMLAGRRGGGYPGGRDFRPKTSAATNADWGRDKQKRLAKIQQAMAALEADARLAAEEERRIEAEKEQQRQAEGRKKPGKPAAAPSDHLIQVATQLHRSGKPAFMKSKDGFVQAYNATGRRRRGRPDHCRARTDAVRPAIRPAGAPDQGHRDNLGRKPSRPQRTSGYCSEANLRRSEAHGIDGYVAPRTRQAPDRRERKKLADR